MRIRYLLTPKTKDLQSKDAIGYVAEQLLAHRGKAIAHAGGPRYAAATAANKQLAAAVVVINSLLGNEGATITPSTAGYQAGVAETETLLQDCAAGNIDALIVWGANPAYTLGRDAVAQAIAGTKVTVTLADRIDETAACSDFVAPLTHDLESWGDGTLEGLDGNVHLIQQPTIRPLWDARPAQDSLMAFVKASGVACPDFVREPVDAKPLPAVISQQPLWLPAAHGLVGFAAMVKQVWQTSVRSASGAAIDSKGFWTAALAQGVVTTPGLQPSSSF